VVGQEKLAVEIGADIFKTRRQWIDAAVATALPMAVSYPRPGKYRRAAHGDPSAERNEAIAIDYRETAPGRDTRDAFLGGRWAADNAKSPLFGARDSAYRGRLPGLALALEKYGLRHFTLRRSETGDRFARGVCQSPDKTLRPRCRWGRGGWRVAIRGHKYCPALTARSLNEGDTLRSADLAETLSASQNKAPPGFYQGAGRGKLVKAIGDASGIMTLDDSKSYQGVIRAPMRGTYRGYTSSRCRSLVRRRGPVGDNLTILEDFRLPTEAGFGSLAACHDRGDEARLCRSRSLSRRSDFRRCTDRDLDRAGLRGETAGQHRLPAAPRRGRRRGRRPRRARAATPTHYSVVDSRGNAVSNPSTLIFPYGVGHRRSRHRRAVNNELDDFTAAPGASTPLAS